MSALSDDKFGLGGDWDAVAHVRFLREQRGAASGYTADLVERLHGALERVTRERDEAGGLAERLKLEAQVHATEARGANATIYEIYQVLSGGTGEPGNWHGAEPARAYVAAADAQLTELQAAVTREREECAALQDRVKELEGQLEGEHAALQKLADWQNAMRLAREEAERPEIDRRLDKIVQDALTELDKRLADAVYARTPAHGE